MNNLKKSFGTDPEDHEKTRAMLQDTLEKRYLLSCNRMNLNQKIKSMSRIILILSLLSISACKKESSSTTDQESHEIIIEDQACTDSWLANQAQLENYRETFKTGHDWHDLPVPPVHPKSRLLWADDYNSHEKWFFCFFDGVTRIDFTITFIDPWGSYLVLEYYP